MKREVLILFALLLFATNIGKAQTSIPKAQSLFVYNFTRLIEWPQSYKTGEFVVGVFGGGSTTAEFRNTLEGKKVSQQTVKLVTYKDAGEIERCHILFVPFGKSNQMKEIMAKLGNQGTLVITERKGMLDEGAVINFIIEGSALKFELNTDAAAKRGLNTSSTLKNMAVK